MNMDTTGYILLAAMSYAIGLVTGTWIGYSLIPRFLAMTTRMTQSRTFRFLKVLWHCLTLILQGHLIIILGTLLIAFGWQFIAG